MCPLGGVPGSRMFNFRGSWCRCHLFFSNSSSSSSNNNNNNNNNNNCSLYLLKVKTTQNIVVWEFRPTYRNSQNWLMCSVCGKEAPPLWLDWCLFLHRWETLLEGPVSCAKSALLKYHRQISNNAAATSSYCMLMEN